MERKTLEQWQTEVINEAGWRPYNLLSLMDQLVIDREAYKQFYAQEMKAKDEEIEFNQKLLTAGRVQLEKCINDVIIIEAQKEEIESLKQQLSERDKCECGRELGPGFCNVCDNDN